MYDPNHYFRYWNWNPNWPILLADSVTDTETTSQRENLVTDSVGHSFNHKHWIFESMIWRLFLKIWVYFPAHKNLYPPKKWKIIVSVSEKKRFGSNTDIGPWFRLTISKPGFGCTLPDCQTDLFQNASVPTASTRHLYWVLYISTTFFMNILCFNICRKSFQVTCLIKFPFPFFLTTTSVCC